MENTKEIKEFYQKVVRVQTELNAPKNLVNKFGGYTYRSAESIYEAAKPLCRKEGLALYLTDEIVTQGDRVYVKSTAVLTDGVGTIKVEGYARECNEKKGMDDAQLTGSCSSYARKYALGGLFLIDDNKDIDEMDNTDKNQSQPQQEQVNKDTGIAPDWMIAKMEKAFKEEAGISKVELYKTYNLVRSKITISKLKEMRAILDNLVASNKADTSNNASA